jgi:dTDP-L-rhamnose 4-epimerase
MTPLPTSERKTPDLCSVYAATKKHQEDLFIAFGQAYGIPTFALRFFNIFGPRQSLANPYTGVAAIFLSRLLASRPPLIFEDGRQSRDFIDVRDVVRAISLAVEYRGDGAHAINIGTGRRMTIGEVASTLAQALEVDIHPQLLGHSRSGDIRHCFADATLAERVLGFRAEHSLESGVTPLVEWCRSAPTRDLVEGSLAELRRQDLVR